MVLLDLASAATPGWLPLLLVIGILIIIGFLYRSMRRNIDRIEVPTRAELDAEHAAEPTRLDG